MLIYSISIIYYLYNFYYVKLYTKTTYCILELVQGTKRINIFGIRIKTLMKLTANTYYYYNPLYPGL